MSLNNTFMELAEKFAENSTCLKRQVGAVLVKDEMIISYGYNRTLHLDIIGNMWRIKNASN